MAQDPSHHHWLFDVGNKSHLPAARRTNHYIDSKGTFKKFGPTSVPGAVLGRLFTRGCGGRFRFWHDFFSLFGVGSKNAVVAPM